MRKTVSSAALIALLLAAAACGKKGGILPPFVYVPQKAENLKAVQRGQHILLNWTNPESYTDGRPLAGLSAIEIWIYDAGSSPQAGAPAMTAGEFESKARQLVVLEQKESPPPAQKKEPQKKASPAEPKTTAPRAGEQIYKYLLTEKDLKAGPLLFAVRVKEAKKGRTSEFSDYAAISPQPLPLPPGNIRAQVFEDRVELGWDAPQENFDHSTPARLKGYNVYRVESLNKLQRLNPDLVRETKFNDANFLFDQPYRYFVRAAASDAAPILESDDSAAADVIPKDIFPPAAPTGLTAMKGANFITLIWDAGREKDLAGYKVWRREAGLGQFVPLTPQPILENTHTDTSVEKNKRYEYAITALDRSGNESSKSETVSEIIKDGWP
jgi:predicted small lipoprotein YifL